MLILLSNQVQFSTCVEVTEMCQHIMSEVKWVEDQLYSFQTRSGFFGPAWATGTELTSSSSCLYRFALRSGVSPHSLLFAFFSLCLLQIFHTGILYSKGCQVSMNGTPQVVTPLFQTFWCLFRISDLLLHVTFRK